MPWSNRTGIRQRRTATQPTSLDTGDHITNSNSAGCPRLERLHQWSSIRHSQATTKSSTRDTFISRVLKNPSETTKQPTCNYLLTKVCVIGIRDDALYQYVSSSRGGGLCELPATFACLRPCQPKMLQKLRSSIVQHTRAHLENRCKHGCPYSSSVPAESAPASSCLNTEDFCCCVRRAGQNPSSVG